MIIGLDMSLRYNIITALESTKEMDYMRIMLGDKIKELRKRDHRTQDDLASALGITNQAVSRWEMNKAYPDVEIIPAIANYFHVSIDELFGYSNDRERTLSSYIEKANALLKPGITPDKRMLKESILFLREALSEFPNEWNLQERLATFLWIKNSNDRKESNDAALKEVVELFEMAYKNSDDFERKDSILASLIMVLGELGDYQKIEEIANQSSAIFNCREIVRTKMAEKGKNDRYVSEAFLALLHQMAEVINMNFDHFSVINNPAIYIALVDVYNSAFGEDDFGWFNSDMCLLYLNAARICSRNIDEAHTIEYFDKAYCFCKNFMEAARDKIEKPSARCLNKATNLPSRFVYVSEKTLKEYMGLFSEKIVSQLRCNPKYAALF